MRSAAAMDHASSNDESIALLQRLFAEHPAWIEAARWIQDDATCRVLFSHRPGELWCLERHDGRTRLRPGAAASPDFAFCFTPRSIARLADVKGGVADFALALFALMDETDPELRVGLRVISPFSTLVRRGYLGLLLQNGPRLGA